MDEPLLDSALVPRAPDFSRLDLDVDIDNPSRLLLAGTDARHDRNQCANSSTLFNRAVQIVPIVQPVQVVEKTNF